MKKQTDTVPDSLYLLRRGRTWYERYPVPTRLRATIGRADLVQSLRTRDFTEARERRWGAIEAFRRQLDEAEGADILMVKPAGPYLDIIAKIRATTALPIAAYQVSGEYLMIKSAAAAGWLDETKIVHESLIGIRRAGADMILTYFAKQWAARCG